MFPLPIFLGDGGFAPRMTAMPFDDEDHFPACGGQCHFDHRPRCQRPFHAFNPMQPRQASQCRRMRGEDVFEPNQEILGLLHPLLSSLGQGGQSNPRQQRNPCCDGRNCCPKVKQPRESRPEPPMADILGQLFNTLGAQNCSSQNENPLSNILKNVCQMNAEGYQNTCAPNASKWQHQVNCAGFKSDNVYVKMAEGEIIVKAVKEERSRDGSISTRSMEKRIPIPRNVLAKKITCKMMPNSILKIEGPIVKPRVGPKAPQEKTQGTQQQSAPCTENGSNNSCGLDMKVLPNGAMVFSSGFPNLNTMFEGLCHMAGDQQPAEEQQTKKSEKPGKKSKSKKPEVEMQIPVQVVNSASVEQSSTHQSLTTEGTTSNEELHSSSPDVTSEETCPMTVDVPVEGETDNTENSQEAAPEYIVEHADSDDDSASTGSKDSDSSFVLLTDQNNPIQSEDVDTTAIEDAIQEEDESQETENQAKPEATTNTVNDAQGAHGPVDITKLITDAVPNLQKFVLNMNDPSKIPQGSFDPQNFAKVISEAVPAIQNLMVPQVQSSRNTPNKKADDKEKGETKAEEFSVRLELPVCAPESIRVSMDDEQRLIHITARKKNAAAGEKSINKSIEVPHTANVSMLKCQYSDGMLTISAPYKTDGKSTRNIPVNV